MICDEVFWIVFWYFALVVHFRDKEILCYAVDGKKFHNGSSGGAIVSVLWAHLGAGYGVPSIQFIAGIGVALFLICSGYGLQASYEKSGIQGFWKKKILKICVPFWLVEAIGLCITHHFEWSVYLKDVLFMEPATGYGWYMQYLMVCYVIFYIVKLTVQKFHFSRKIEFSILLGVFLLWLVIDSLFFVTVPTMPFLRSRQMLSFPMGVLIAQKKNELADFFDKKNSMLCIFVGTILGIAMMGFTQLPMIKALPYIQSNLFALLTVFPLALVILLIGKCIPRVINNRFLMLCGTISYEMYLIHAFMLNVLNPNYGSVVLFTVATFGMAFALHQSMKAVLRIFDSSN